MLHFFKKLFSLDNFFATVFIFVTMWGISKIDFNLDVLNPVEDMLGDFQITDLVSSKIREEMSEDTNIVLVNIGTLSRAEIAEQVNIINKCEPKVIGIDSFFRRLKPNNPEGDSLLALALSQAKNLVMVTKLHLRDSTDIFDSLETSHPIFMQNAKGASANLITEGKEAFRTARVFSSFDTISAGSMSGYVDTFFAVKVADTYRAGSAEVMVKRRKETETIRYRGNIYGIKSKFFAIDAHDILDSNFLPDLLRNKIVLMGYMGSEIGTSENIWDEDKFFTPLNDHYVGKAVPDMFGIVVHANIVSMILNQRFVDESNEWVQFLIGFVICFLSVAAFHFVLERLPQLFDPVTKAVQLLLLVILTYIEMQIYHKQSFVLNLGVALGAIALAPDLLEIYLHLIKKFVTFLYHKASMLVQINKTK
jgi:CHASE2 domain-containing sensor protein